VVDVSSNLIRQEFQKAAAASSPSLGRLAVSMRRYDPYTATGGAFIGIIIEAQEFPGWESIRAMAAHFRFVRDHHKQVKRVALVTNSALGNWRHISSLQKSRGLGQEMLKQRNNGS
jgi:hypothetical protein